MIPTKPDRDLVAKLVGPLSLHKRIVALEQEIQESRRLNQRLSDIIDVITEVLVPAVDRDDDRVRAALARLETAVTPPGRTDEPGGTWSSAPGSRLAGGGGGI